MTKSIYIINPGENSPSHYGSEVLRAWEAGARPILADLNIVTIAAFVPESWSIRLCDERVENIDYDHPCDYVALTGKISQRKRMFAISEEFRNRGRTVVIGGAHASLDPDDVRSHADVLVRGEIEEEARKIFDALEKGTYQSEYICGKPDITNSPVPRWELYLQGMGLVAQVQTSRGCPFDCEFCDVIQYLGRKQRWKLPDQVLRELELLHGIGYREVFLADDNFTVMRKRATELLTAIRRWNEEKAAERVVFTTQLSIDIARTPDLLNLASEAGLERCFIGIETPNEMSLKETGKRQNMRIDLVSEVEKIAKAGIMPMCGMIVGFDNDGPDIFGIQARFIDRLPMPNVSIAMLVAPHATPLHARLKEEDRLVENVKIGGAHFLRTNIVPKQMTRAQLRNGYVWLMHQVYDPINWLNRLRRYVELTPPAAANNTSRKFMFSEILLAKRLTSRGNKERAAVNGLQELARARPDLVSNLGYALTFYCQARYMLETAGVWNPAGVDQNAPHVAA
jgi:hypothetical protein